MKKWALWKKGILLCLMEVGTMALVVLADNRYLKSVFRIVNFLDSFTNGRVSLENFSGRKRVIHFMKKILRIV